MSFAWKLAPAGLLAGLLSVAPLHAQQNTTPPNTTAPNTTAPNTTAPNTTAPDAAAPPAAGTGTVTRYDDRRGFDWGWLGLLGLLGLFGLRKPTNVLYTDRDRTYQDRTERTTTR
jgi:MYXO-CTERM domain-containing protein